MYHECRHIFTSGRKCQSPALTDQTFCYFHSNTRKKTAPAHQPYDPYTHPNETVLALTPLEDADAIQLALSDVVLALAANRIDPRRARILIYGLQVASLNHRHRAAVAIKEEAPEKAIVREAHKHADGTLIGPEKQTPDPEEIKERERPSLGAILLREVQLMRQRKAEEEARQKAEAAASDTTQKEQPGVPHPERSEGWDQQPIPATIPQIQAVADTPRAPRASLLRPGIFRALGPVPERGYTP
jgi:hypothetical protein